MNKANIIEKVRKNREKISSDFDYDIHKYSIYIYEKQKMHKEKLVSEPFKKED